MSGSLPRRLSMTSVGKYHNYGQNTSFTIGDYYYKLRRKSKVNGWVTWSLTRKNIKTMEIEEVATKVMPSNTRAPYAWARRQLTFTLDDVVNTIKRRRGYIK